jgi:glycosyltransferase involved in cell wall biosynthesis
MACKTCGGVAASICIATKNKQDYIMKVLESIYVQIEDDPKWEVIVVDDGSDDETWGRLKSWERYANFRLHHLENPNYRNPSVARNVAYRHARGEIIIAQSDDVLHVGSAVQDLVYALNPKEFVIANVFNISGFPPEFSVISEYTSPTYRRPFFFLGALWKEDLYAVGGNDEEFTEPGYDDDWFGDCLINGQKLTPVFSDKIIGYHVNHHRPQGLSSLVEPSKALYEEKKKKALAGEIKWEASGGPWT